MHDVSIIIPIYCTTEESIIWLEECLESAVRQDCEVVSINDKSLIDISKVIKKFKLRHIDLKEHRGVSVARNAGVMASAHKLIIPLDCDDRFAEGAVGKLLSAWDGTTPVYPDVKKFGLENIPHFHLLDFACDHIIKHVGFSSVNVLHAKEQWRLIGGWDPTLEFYEDGEYNARLFAKYCGKRLPEPLVEYRMHENQRTKTYRKQSGTYARKILESIRRLDMPCSSCNKKKTFVAGVPSTTIVSKSIDVKSLPGELEGRLLVEYVGGKGRGKHYYRGPRTSFPYKVVYGDHTYVDPKDVKKDENDASLFIRIVQQTTPTAPVQEPVKSEEVQRTARINVVREPLVDETQQESLPDITNMTVQEVYGMDAIPVESAKKLLSMERNGKNRVKVIQHLQKIISG